MTVKELLEIGDWMEFGDSLAYAVWTEKSISEDDMMSITDDWIKNSLNSDNYFSDESFEKIINTVIDDLGFDPDIDVGEYYSKLCAVCTLIRDVNGNI